MRKSLRRVSSARMANLPATIVFDLDGTLVDTAPDLVNALNAALALEGIDVPITLDEARTLIGAGARALIARGLSARDRRVSEERFEDLFGAFLAHYEAHICIESRPYPGMPGALEALSAAGHRLAVCTNKSERFAVKLLEAMHLRGRFLAVVGGDTLDVSKPDPRPLLAAIERSGGGGAPAMLVGDSATDFHTARNAGLPIVGVTFGYSDTPMADLGADALIDHYDELVQAIDGLLAGERVSGQG